MLEKLLINGLCPNFISNQMERKNVGIKNGKIVYVGAAFPNIIPAERS